MPGTVLSRYLTILIDTMERDYGVAAQQLYAAAGVAPISGERVRLADAEALWVAAEASARDPLLGLKVGTQVRYSTYSTFGHVLVTSKTVADSLRAVCDLGYYVGGAARFRMVRDGGSCTIVHEPRTGTMRAESVRAEAVLLPFVRFTKWAAPGVAPLSVQLMRDSGDHDAAFEEAFGAPVRFGAQTHAITWDAGSLARPMTDANPALNDMLRQHLEEELKQDASLAARTESLITDAIGAGDVLQMADVAAAFGLSERSLQRALAQERTSFRNLLTAARRKVSEQALRQTAEPVATLAHRLGYSEPAAFVRAFRRWTGHAPSRWRKLNQS